MAGGDDFSYDLWAHLFSGGKGRQASPLIRAHISVFLLFLFVCLYYNSLLWGGFLRFVMRKNEERIFFVRVWDRKVLRAVLTTGLSSGLGFSTWEAHTERFVLLCFSGALGGAEGTI